MRETNFKETEIGLIPADWEVKTLGEITSEVMSGATSLGGESSYLTSGIPLVRSQNVLDAVFNYKGLAFINKDQAYKLQNVTIKEGDILLNITGDSVARTCIAPNNINDGRVNQHVAIVRLLDSNNNYFVMSMLIQNKPRLLHLATTGASRNSLTKEKILSFQLPLPLTTDEQAEIANAISSVDKLIEKIDRLIVKKENFKLGIMQQLLSGKQRLKGFNGKWVEKPFGEVFTFLGNNTLSRDFLSDTIGEIYNIHYGDVLIKFGEILDMNNDSVPRINFDYDVNHSYLLNDGDIVMADTAEDETVGKVTELANCNGRKIVAGLHTFALRPLIGFAPRFLGFALNFSNFHNQLIPLIQGSKVASISKKAIVDTIIFYPSDLKEQEKIANLLTSLNTEIATIKKEREKYLAIKQGMMQQLLTGKIRLV